MEIPCLFYIFQLLDLKMKGATSIETMDSFSLPHPEQLLCYLPAAHLNHLLEYAQRSGSWLKALTIVGMIFVSASNVSTSEVYDHYMMLSLERVSCDLSLSFY